MGAIPLPTRCWSARTSRACPMTAPRSEGPGERPDGSEDMTRSSTLSRSFPTVKYLVAPVRWMFGSRRRVLGAAALLLAIIAAPVLWWSLQLVGLPDVGDPFDARASRVIPDDRNA